jgi:hypothetical protein
VFWAHNRPQDRSKQSTSPVPSPKSTNVLFSRAAPYLLREPISHKVEGYRSILLYFAARRRRCWRFAEDSKHVPRVGCGRCDVFFVSPTSDLLYPQPPNRPRTRKKENIVHVLCSVEDGSMGVGGGRKSN